MAEKITNPLQESDDQHFIEQPGSEAGMLETLIEQDSPNVIRNNVQTGAVEKLIEPINVSNDREAMKETDKDQNLHTQFVDTNAIDAASRK
ncbi:MAG: hypothetical protein KAU20_07520 [Nanoarchaeota archaeon]|nr:hypothetical protein [Nanoarchaeota archaeon]